MDFRSIFMKIRRPDSRTARPGNVAFLLGLCFLLGVQKTGKFFFRKEKALGAPGTRTDVGCQVIQSCLLGHVLCLPYSACKKALVCVKVGYRVRGCSACLLTSTEGIHVVPFNFSSFN